MNNLSSLIISYIHNCETLGFKDLTERFWGNSKSELVIALKSLEDHGLLCSEMDNGASDITYYLTKQGEAAAKDLIDAKNKRPTKQLSDVSKIQSINTNSKTLFANQSIPLALVPRSRQKERHHLFRKVEPVNLSELKFDPLTLALNSAMAFNKTMFKDEDSVMKDGDEDCIAYA